ncbi:glutamyl-tRNA synthetase [Eremomyces bilateralis CBS 781.70]|uniref:Glutamate--tRNA ligase, mitochondrial n=1 Tax=Eremomyces bilateralis CBS 781.70 TaxID=1392243 RepID=A0A6G1GAK4_9PEZI|nr:glutamyl-tRNA synthetase [Eremomyces bilateralis CBS 781.70]KAF1815095.1 glutamyl-tRNA synthetase [Eremomyces bilateralis CBS 781.70]
MRLPSLRHGTLRHGIKNINSPGRGLSPFQYVTLLSRPSGSRWLSKATKLPEQPARTRFAPSPTGYLHLGSLRTALFNYLLARRTGGQFLLRIEDTDQKRTVPDAEEKLFKDLRWAGLEWDEGPEVGGPYGPYRQSERTALYQLHAGQLLETGHAYRCFCTQERLQELAEERHKLGLPTDYDRRCFHMSKEESNAKAADAQPHVIRLLSPPKYPSFIDLVYGKVPKGATLKRTVDDAFDDPILLKSDGLPTYHLANVVDDHHMEITHVVRGSEWLIATPKHIAMYEAFGWKPPAFAHVGLLVDEEGNKLSKRKLDIDIASYRDKGVLPDALVNFVALLGWSHNMGKDFCTVERLQELFRPKFTKGNTTVDIRKLWFLQSKHAANITEESGQPFADLVRQVEEVVVKEYNVADRSHTLQDTLLPTYISSILKADARNYSTPEEFVKRVEFFFRPQHYPPIFDGYQKSNVAVDTLASACRQILQASPWTKEGIQKEILTTVAQLEKSIASEASEKHSHRAVSADVHHFLRGVILGGRAGPTVAESMEILGKAFCAARFSEFQAARPATAEDGTVSSAAG